MGNEITKEEYEILGFLLDFISEGETDYLVLQNETENDFVTGNVDLFQKQQEELKGLPAGLMLDFVTKNMKSYPLDAALLQTERKIMLESSEELEKAFDGAGTSGPGWEAFYKNPSLKDCHRSERGAGRGAERRRIENRLMRIAK